MKTEAELFDIFVTESKVPFQLDYFMRRRRVTGVFWIISASSLIICYVMSRINDIYLYVSLTLIDDMMLMSPFSFVVRILLDVFNF